MELKEVIYVTKPIKGSYNSRMYIEGSKSTESQFMVACLDFKNSLMRNDYKQYEFLSFDIEVQRKIAFHVAEKLQLPLVFL